MNPTVSIVMPAYNAEKYIGHAIRSVLKQTYHNYELIIVDDASTDNTVQIVRNFPDKRLRLIRNKVNTGEGNARDTAIKNSTGDWIAVIDADDAWHSERLSKMLSLNIPANKKILIIDNIMQCYQSNHKMINWKPVWNKNNIFARNATLELGDYLNAERFLIKPLIPKWSILNNNLTHSDLKFGADTEFFIKLIKKADLKLRTLPEPLYLYRLTPGSMSANTEKYKIFRDMFSRLLKMIDFNEYEKKAIIHRISILDHEIKYFCFLNALKRRKLSLACKIFIKNPYNLLILIKKFPATIHYRSTLFLNKGTAR